MDDRLFEELIFQLNNHTNMAHWEATDRLGADDLENINATIRHVFAPYIRQYAYTAVMTTLQTCRNTLCHVVWASMNVPFPRDPFEHIDRVVENAVNVTATNDESARNDHGESLCPPDSEKLAESHCRSVVPRVSKQADV